MCLLVRFWGFSRVLFPAELYVQCSVVGYVLRPQSHNRAYLCQSVKVHLTHICTEQ